MTKICRGRIVLSFGALSRFTGAFFKTKKYGEKLVQNFEREFSGYIGISYAIAVSSGKMALYLILKALKAQEGDEIIVPVYTVSEVVDIIKICGLKPVFVDTKEEDGNMDADLVTEKIGKRAKFILMTHIHGCPCDINKIIEISRRHNLIIIEDAAQALGAEHCGVKTGNFGKIAYFSFGMLKNINTLGGGMIVTNDEKVAFLIRDLIKSFKDISKIELLKRLIIACFLSIFTHPWVFSVFVYPLLRFSRGIRLKHLAGIFKCKKIEKYELEKKNKLKFSGAQAALGLVQLKTLDRLNEDKIAKARLLNRIFSQLPKVCLVKERKNIKNIYLNYVIRVKERENLINFLFQHGIDTSPGAVISCSRFDEDIDLFDKYPKSIIFEKENLYLPVYPSIKEKHIFKIADSVKKYYERL